VSTLTASPRADAVERRTPRRGPSRPDTWRRVLAACALLLGLYVGLAFLNDPMATLGTDSGGKVATLHAMQHNGGLNPDLHYWASRWDPDGTLHPLYYTKHIGDRWVNATTVPMLDVAEPLYELGGIRLALLLPMLGSVFAALGARALARRLGAGQSGGWWAFWAVGLASPLAVYALDLWEHSIGVALMMWGIVLTVDVLDRRAGWRGALGVGLLFGAAATMRTEALVYGLVTALFAGVVILRRERRLGPVIRFGSLVAAGVATMLVTNQVLERVTVGGSIRAGRATDTAASAGANVGERVGEALTTTIGFNHWPELTDWFLGALAVALVAYAAWRLLGAERQERVLGYAALAGAALIYLTRFQPRLGFVPGVLTASPLAVVGLALAWKYKAVSRPFLIALLALPVVWVFQYSGGASAQWGGRYVLVTGTLLVVTGAIVLSRAVGIGRVVAFGAAVAVTACGVAWLSQRSHAIADGMRTIVGRHDQVVISEVAHLLREGGAFYHVDSKWLTATTSAEIQRAAKVARESGASEFALLVQKDGFSRPRTLDGYTRGRSQTVEFPGLEIYVTTYTRAGSA
jgi:hypothetical protein